MDLERIKKAGSPGSAVAIAVAIALGIATAVPANVTASSLTPQKHDFALQKQYSLKGPLLVGPIEEILSGGKAISILGKTLDLKRPAAHLLPAQYVAVFGTLSTDGTIMLEAIKPLDYVYAPGSSLVFHSGVISNPHLGTGLVSIGNMEIDGFGLPGFEEWAGSQQQKLALVVGTQSISGAPIRADLVVTFTGTSFLKINGTGLQGIDGSGLQGIDGSGLQGIDGSGLQGIDGSGLQGIDGSGLQGIDGSGLQGIDGSGLQGIDGSGLQGIDGSGLQGIDGSGLQGIDGSGLQGIDGSGLQGIDGSGLQGIDGSGLQGIDGSGLQGIDGSGLQGIDGSGLQGIDGSGAF